VHQRSVGVETPRSPPGWQAPSRHGGRKGGGGHTGRHVQAPAAPGSHSKFTLLVNLCIIAAMGLSQWGEKGAQAHAIRERKGASVDVINTAALCATPLVRRRDRQAGLPAVMQRPSGSGLAPAALSRDDHAAHASCPSVSRRLAAAGLDQRPSRRELHAGSPATGSVATACRRPCRRAPRHHDTTPAMTRPYPML